MSRLRQLAAASLIAIAMAPRTKAGSSAMDRVRSQ